MGCGCGGRSNKIDLKRLSMSPFLKQKINSNQESKKSRIKALAASTGISSDAAEKQRKRRLAILKKLGHI